MNAERLRQIMTLRGVQPKKLADIAGVSESTLKSILYGKSTKPNFDMLQKMATALDCSVADFADNPDHYTIDLSMLFPPSTYTPVNGISSELMSQLRELGAMFEPKPAENLTDLGYTKLEATLIEEFKAFLLSKRDFEE